MLGKRKDHKGRVLKAGESQRKNKTYEYRYQDSSGKRHSVYAKSLDELRQKETEIQRDITDGIDPMAGELTVSELVARYINLRRNLKKNSLRAYGSGINRINASPFGQRKIKTIKKSDAMTYLISLHDEGLKQNTVGIIHNILRPAFDMAVEDANVRQALTKFEQEQYLTFIHDYGNGNFYDDILILLHTGLRVSELYGLTKTDIDFENRRIHINKQLCRTGDRPYFVTEPKTKSGIRYVPMSDIVYKAFQHVVNTRSTKIEMIVDGYTGFIFLDKAGKPKVGMHLQNYMRLMHKKFVKLHGNSMPKVTPHVLRHTFCTNAQQAGIDVKSLQALMGHSNVSVTLDVYTHTDYDAVEKAFFKVFANE